MSKHHRISHCDAEHTMAEVRKEQEKMANKVKCHEKSCGK